MIIAAIITVRAHLHLLQSLQFAHEILDLPILLYQHSLESLQLSRVSTGTLELHQSGYLNLQNTNTPISCHWSYHQLANYSMFLADVFIP